MAREIMHVDGVTWDEAQPKLEALITESHEGASLALLPYKGVIYGAIGVGIMTFPLCFHLDSVLAFNDAFVTADVAEPKDLETWLEVGSWSWNWMEPPLGQISFFLLCLQLSRDQARNIGRKSYSEKLKLKRAMTFASKYPQYSNKVVVDLAESAFDSHSN